MAISSILGSSALLPAGLGFRNLLINSEFRINQRGYTSASSLASGAYGFDRWKASTASTTLTFTSAPQGQMVTINSGGSVEQVIERENVTAGTYILSFAGTATGRVYNTGATPPAYAASPITVTLDGLANVEVEFTASGGTRTLWKAQLEANLQPTPFEQRPIGVELALCQRYYFRQTAEVTGLSQRIGGYGCVTGGNTFLGSIRLPVTMRTRPTSSLEYSGLMCTDNVAFDSSGGTWQMMGAGYNTTNSVGIYGSPLSGASTITFCQLGLTNSASSYVGISAEL